MGDLSKTPSPVPEPYGALVQRLRREHFKAVGTTNEDRALILDPDCIAAAEAIESLARRLEAEVRKRHKLRTRVQILDRDSCECGCGLDVWELRQHQDAAVAAALGETP